MIKLKSLFLVAAVVATTTLTGCARTAPVVTPETAISSSLSVNKVKQAIFDAGLKRDWIMHEVSPGIIDGKLISRGHSVNVRITYSTKSYKINYVNSQNLLASGGKIHKNYNRWVNNLDKDIQLSLAAMN